MVSTRTLLEICTVAIALLGYLPLFPHVEPLARLFFPAALLFRFLRGRRQSRGKEVWITAGSVGVTLFYLLRFSAATITVSSASLLVALLAVRLAGEKSPRNYLQVFALSVFCLAGSTLFDLSPLFLLYLTLLLALIASSLVFLTFVADDPRELLPRKGVTTVVGLALLIPAISVPLIPFFFTILPRTQFPLWDIVKIPGRESGFTEKVQPGASSSLADRPEVAFRAESPPLDRESLYWRGIVLNTFVEGSWVRRDPPRGETDVPGKGVVADQVIYPETDQRFLVGLSVPIQISGIRGGITPDFVATRWGGGGKRTKYRVRSVVADTIRVSRGFDPAPYLSVEGAPPRLLKAAASFKGKPPEEVIRRTGEFFRSRRIQYAREDLPTGADALDRFLFDTRKGYCEYFASACALMLREARVPARLVGGYLGGEYNDFGGYYVVTGSAAHVWVEALVPGKGWVRVDPSRWSIGFTGEEGKRSGFLRTLSLYGDSLSYFWNARVVGFDLERQATLAKSAGKRMVSLRRESALRGVFLLVLAVGCIVLVRQGFSRRRSQEERLLDSFLEAVQSRYGVRCRDIGLLAGTAAIEDPAVGRFVEMFTGEIYRDRRITREDARVLAGLVRRIRNG